MIDFERLLALLEAGDDLSLIKATEVLNAIMPDFGATLDPNSTLAPQSPTFAIQLSRLISNDSPLSEPQKEQLEPFLNSLIEASSSKVSTIDQANEDLGTDSHVIERELANRNFDDTLAITRFLAEGGLGKVWVAKDHAVQREIVLKQLRDTSAGDTTKDRFLHEAQVTAGLEHPNIVPVYGLNADIEGQPYYTMKYVRGDTFADMIQRHHEGSDRESDLNKLFDVFQHICNAVAYAHSRGIIHRDLKPENIAIGEFGEVLVLDWGLAKRLSGHEATSTDKEPTQAHDQSRQGRVMGTPNYMAPEQARGATDEMDERTDIYALGAILFEILTGRPPRYKGDRAKEIRTVLNDIQAGHIPLARELRPSVPKRLESICTKALERSAAQRYQTVRDLRNDLMAFRNYLPITAHQESFIDRTKRLMARHRLITSVILIAAIIFAGGSLGYTLFEGYAHNTAKLANKQINSLSTSTAQKHAETITQLKQAENSRLIAESQLIEAERDAAKARFLSNAAKEKRQERTAANNQASSLAKKAREDEASSRLSLSDAAQSAEIESDSLSKARVQFIRNNNVAFTDSIHRITKTFTEYFPTNEVFAQLQLAQDLANTIHNLSENDSPHALFQYITAEYAATLPEVTRIAIPGTVHSFATTPDGITLVFTDNSLKTPGQRIGHITTTGSIATLPIIPESSISKVYSYHGNTAVIQFQDQQERFIQYWDLSSSQALSPRIELPIGAKLTIDKHHSHIVIAHSNGAVLINTKTGTRRNIKLALSGEVVDAACNPVATRLYISTSDGSVYWLDLESKSLKRYRLPQVSSRLSHQVDGSLYFTTATGYLYRWREPTATPKVVIRGATRNKSFTCLDDHLRHLCVVNAHAGATIHRLDTNTSVEVLPMLQIHDAIFTPNGRYIAFRSITGELAIADSHTGDLVLPPTKHGYGILQFEFAADSSYLISLDREGVIRQWQWSEQNPNLPQYAFPRSIKDAWSIPKDNKIYTLSTRNTLTKFTAQNNGLSIDSSVKLRFAPKFIAHLTPYTLALSNTRYALFEGSNLYIQDRLPEQITGVVIKDDRLHIVSPQEEVYELDSSNQWKPSKATFKTTEIQYVFSADPVLVRNAENSTIQVAQQVYTSVVGNLPFMSYTLDTNNAPQLQITPTTAHYLPVETEHTLGFFKLNDEMAIVNSNSIAIHSPTARLQSKAAVYLDTHSNSRDVNLDADLAKPHLQSQPATTALGESPRSTPPSLNAKVGTTLRAPFVDPRVFDLIEEPIETTFQPTPQGDQQFIGVMPSSSKLAITNTGADPIQLDSLSFNAVSSSNQDVAHVRIQSLSDMHRLALTEIELYDSDQSLIPISDSTCSSSTGAGRSTNAYDGGKDADINRGRSTFVSQNEFRPWVEFTPENPAIINRVQLHNTSDLSLRSSLKHAIIEFYNANHTLLGSYNIDTLPDPELSIDTSRPPTLVLSNAILLRSGKRPAYVDISHTSKNVLLSPLILEPKDTLTVAIDPDSVRSTDNVNVVVKTLTDTTSLKAVPIPESYLIHTGPSPIEITSYFDRLELYRLIAEKDLKAAFDFAITRWQQSTKSQQLQEQLFYAKYLAALGILSNESPKAFHSQLMHTLNSPHSTNDKLLLLPFMSSTLLSSPPELMTIQELIEDSTASASARLIALATFGYITEQHAKNIRLIREPAATPIPKSVLTALLQTMVLRAMNHQSIKGVRFIQANLKLYLHNHDQRMSDFRSDDWPYYVLLDHLFSVTEANIAATTELTP